MQKRCEDYRSLFEQLPSGIIVFDDTGVVIAANGAAGELMGAPPEAIVGGDLHDHLQPDLIAVAERALAGETITLEGEHRFAGRGGCHRLRTRWAPLIDERGAIIGGIVGAIGVSPLRSGVNAGEHQTLWLDPVTMLPDRAHIVAMLEEAVASPQGESAGLALIWLDIDRFEDVNNALGREGGDRLLQHVGERLANLLRGTDLVCRAGEDEFLMLVRGTGSRRHLNALAERLVDSFGAAFSIGGVPVCLTASCGTAAYPADGTDAQALMENAHTALSTAKRLGGGICRSYVEEMRTGSAAKVRQIADLRQAVQDDQFEVHYQPQVAHENHSVVALEALVRWVHPERGLLLPGEFIPLAEESGLIDGLGRRVLAAACAQMRTWRSRLDRPLRLAVNVSPREFQRESLVRDLRRAARDSGMAATDMEIEITETAIFADPARAARLVAELRAAGFSIALDDFGTGYSSLTHLRQIPIDRVKIDRSFIAACTTDDTAAAIIAAVVRLAHSLGLEAVAEGVETVEQLELLHDLGCDRLQGFFFARPLPAADCELYLLSHAMRPAPKAEVPS